VVNDALRRYKTRYAIRVTSWLPKGSSRGGGEAMARSSVLLQCFEVGTCRLAGHFSDFEEAAVA
jgi:hypothetical protein